MDGFKAIILKCAINKLKNLLLTIGKWYMVSEVRVRRRMDIFSK
jgi:hypothetical protein